MTQYPVIVIGKVASPVNIVGADEGGLHVDPGQGEAVQLPHPERLPGRQRLADLKPQQRRIERLGHPHPPSPGLVFTPAVLAQIIGSRSKYIRQIAPEIFLPSPS